MIRLRRSAERGHFRNDWLDARFSFNFGDYQAPGYAGYSDLLVFNEDRVAPGGGFTAHGHKDVEVMSYPLAGVVEHRDSLGHQALMQPGDVHLMRAGHGIVHSEMNGSAKAPEHHLQWWIRPAVDGLTPTYARLSVPPATVLNQWRLLAAPDGRDGALTLAQDAQVWLTRLDDAVLCWLPAPDRRIYLHVARGALTLNGQHLAAGDAAFVEQEELLTFEATPGAQAELLLFDLR
jgi:redox-sensitive bicupin YhaK (pirin superfamily)